MKNLEYRVVHAVPAFMVGGFVWCVLAMVLSQIDHGVLGYFTVPGHQTSLILLTPALVFFPAFFILRWLRLLHVVTFAGSMALGAFVLSVIGEPTALSVTVLRVVMAGVSGSVAFLVLRGAARADSGAKA